MRVYGTCQLLKEGVWRVDAEPHVILRMKRLFAGAAKAAKKPGTLRLADNEENCRDLLWFIQRYPLETDPADRMVEQATAHRDRAALVDQLMTGKRKPHAFDMAFPAREYQRVAAEIILKSGSLLVADDLGLGKTCVAICTLTDPATLPAVVVTMTHLTRQWENEIKRFVPKLHTHVVKKGTPYDIRDRQGKTPDVIILNYAKLSGWAETLAASGMNRSVVMDEAQELRHAKSADGPTKKYQAAVHVAASAKYRTFLSATPIYNYGGEMFNVLEVLRPGALGTRAEFMGEWCAGSEEKPRIQDPRAFGSFLREQGLMIRRTRKDVARELPPLSIVPHVVECDTEALKSIQGNAAELARIILTQGEQHRGQKMMASEELSMLLRQATGLGKAPYVAEFVRLLCEQGERVILAGWHHAVFDLWRDLLKDYNPAFYTGRESVPQKEASKAAFVAGTSRVLVMSLRSGAGLDGLQGVCRTVVHGELDWSPAVHNQVTGRVHRDGQKEPVVAYFLVSESGSDPIVSDVLGIKGAQLEGVINPHHTGSVEIAAGSSGVDAKALALAYLKQRGLAPPGHEKGAA